MAKYIKNMFMDLGDQMIKEGKNTSEINRNIEMERVRKRIRGVSRQTPKRKIIIVDPLTLQRISAVKSKKSSGNYNNINKKIVKVKKDTPYLKDDLFVKKPKAKKSCPEGKVLNPKTNRCVKIPVKKPKAKKSCPEGKVLNPKTNRCVKIPMKKIEKK